MKVKVRPEQEFVVVGYTKGQGRRTRLGALVVAVNEDGAGCAGSATSARGSRSRRSTSCSTGCARSSGSDSPLAEIPKMPRVRKS